MGGGDAEALEGFLDGLAADPVGKAAVVHVGLGGGPLLGQRGGEKPGLHHAHIVLLAVNGSDPAQVLLGERIGFQKVTHQHPNAETAGVLVAGGHPTAHLGQQLRPVTAKNAGRQLVASGPVVHKRKETLQPLDATAVVPLLGNEEGMQLILFEIAMRQRGKEGFRFSGTAQFLGQQSQRWGADTDDALRRKVGQQGALEGGILFVAQREKTVGSGEWRTESG